MVSQSSMDSWAAPTCERISSSMAATLSRRRTSDTERPVLRAASSTLDPKSSNPW